MGCPFTAKSVSPPDWNTGPIDRVRDDDRSATAASVFDKIESAGMSTSGQSVHFYTRRKTCSARRIFVLGSASGPRYSRGDLSSSRSLLANYYLNGRKTLCLFVSCHPLVSPSAHFPSPGFPPESRLSHSGGARFLRERLLFLGRSMIRWCLLHGKRGGPPKPHKSTNGSDLSSTPHAPVCSKRVLSRSLWR